MLILELTRELLVLASSQQPSLLVMKSIWQSENLVMAEGRWRRTDGGDRLIPNMVNIECDRRKGTCLVVDVTLSKQSVMPPEASFYSANFTENGATYSYTTNCVVYDVTIDARADHATQIRRMREKSEQTPLTTCGVIDDRIEMALTSGWDSDLGDNELPEGFYPIVRLLSWAFS
ncbi:hypothetical protein [Parasphingorhabdus sp.]|uniref:hypothetical protein n=1 Tax=Parasphingorhabdus sp. TaxID=2709688 RepID=UPI003D288492